MLVLSRKVGETIELPSLGVKIQVTDLKRSRVGIGIEAPGEVEIMRGEKTSQPHFPRRRSQQERTLNEQLLTLEAEIVALAEMASDEHEHTAKITASESLQRIRKLRRQQESETDAPTQPLADFVAARSEVLDHLMFDRQPSNPESPPTIVRQASVDYAVGLHCEESKLQPFTESDWDKTGYHVA